MTAYFRPGSTEVIALETDYIDSGTNAFVRQLISAYSRLPAANDTPVSELALFLCSFSDGLSSVRLRMQ